MIVYDVTNRDSFVNVDMWLNEVERYASDSRELLLVGNKTDLAGKGKREVEMATAKEKAEKLDIPFVETSAKELNGNADTAFALLARRLLDKHRKPVVSNPNEGVVVGPGKPIPPRGTPCCGSA